MALTFLVDAQHEGVVRGIQIQAHHVADLLDKEWIGGELEAGGPMQLHAKQTEIALHRTLGNPGFTGQRTDAPVGRAVPRLALQRRVQQRRNRLIIDRARLPGPQFIVHALQPTFEEPPPPLADRRRGNPLALADHLIRVPGGARQHDLRALRQTRGQRTRPRHRLQLVSFLLAQHQLRFRPTHRHTGTPFVSWRPAVNHN